MHARKTLLAALTAATLLPLGMAPAQAAPAIHLGTIQYDSPGADTGSNHSLNAEWVQVVNRGNTRKTLTGWTLSDRNGHVYHFPRFSLAAGASVRVHTGKGTNTGKNLLWGQSAYVWNNTGDRATNGLTLDGLDAHDSHAVVAGLCIDLVASDPGGAIRHHASQALENSGDLHDPKAVSRSYIIASNIMKL